MEPAEDDGTFEGSDEEEELREQIEGGNINGVALSSYSKTLLSLRSGDSVYCLEMKSTIKWHLALNYVSSDNI